MQTIEDKYVNLEAKDHVLKKDMWAGSHEIIETNEYLARIENEKIVMEMSEIAYPPSLYKCIDEATVNALDHHINSAGTKKPVSYIKLRFEKETGRISVENNGGGIEIEIHKKKNMYVPQMIFGEMFSGSNMEKQHGSITGGTNGVGIKLANILSTEFEVETVCKKVTKPTYHKKYIQKWRNHMNIVNEPIIEESKEEEHTKISFLPDYTGVFKYKKYDKNVAETIEKLVLTRALMAAAYTDAKCDVYYNEMKLPVKNISDLSKIMFPEAPIITTILGKKPRQSGTSSKETTPKTNIGVAKYPWEISIALVENEAKSKKNFCQISIVNGVIVKTGKHTEYLLDEIIEGIKARITKQVGNTKINFKPEFIYANIFLFACCKIEGVQWDGQRKEGLSVKSKAQFNAYKFDKKVLDEIADQLRETILENLYGQTKSTTSKKIPAVDKYTPATMAGKKGHSLKCSLLLPEGDSAKGMCTTGLTHQEEVLDKNGKVMKKEGKIVKKALLGYEYYGILTLGGVIVNVRKNMSIIKSLKGNKYQAREKLSNNKFWKSFLTVTGLNPDYRYDPKSNSYEKEMSELRYGKVIGFVDQDHDGVGFIFSLILNLFEYVWPNLLKAGYVQRFATPLRRAYPKRGGEVKEFYSDFEYNEWAKMNNTDNYEISYIKGLATHTPIETIHMFRNFHKNLFTYTIDDNDQTHSDFEIYFGEDPALRKKELSTPVEEPPKELIIEQLKTTKISCSNHLKYEAKAHKHMNLFQKLWSAIDGMNESGRKILDGCFKKFLHETKPLKVSTLAGFIQEHENYHHGQASLENSITGKAFLAVGGIQLPQLQPKGNFGSRLQGGNDAGQPRYIATILNKKLTNILFPASDMYLLDYTFDEGIRGEPKYFVPIIPTSITEHIEIPADGWKIKVWGRDVFDVINNVRKLIENDRTNTNDISDTIETINKIELDEMRVNTFGFKGEIRNINGKSYSYGKYIFDEKTCRVTITELPIRTWTEPYFEKIKKKEYVIADSEYTVDHSSTKEVNISIQINPEKYPIITEKYGDEYSDCLEIYLELRDHMDSHLNMINSNMGISEFNTYEEIIKHWYPIRKQLYQNRINREIILLTLQIELLNNHIRYVELYDTLSIRGKKKEIAESILENNKFIRFNKSKLDNPKFIANDLLEYEIKHVDSSYDYLLNTTDLQKLEDAIIKRSEKLNALKSELNELIKKSHIGNFIGAQIWLDELELLEHIIIQGRNTNWTYGEEDKFKFI